MKMSSIYNFALKLIVHNLVNKRNILKVDCWSAKQSYKHNHPPKTVDWLWSYKNHACKLHVEGVLSRSV